jgi:hypothetical protein
MWYYNILYADRYLEDEQLLVRTLSREYKNMNKVGSPDDGGSTQLWNVGQHVLDYTAVHPRRLSFILAAVRTWNVTFLLLFFWSSAPQIKDY